MSYMTRDSRLSAALHLLLHMARHAAPMTSEKLSKVMDTNPVVIRRILAGIRDAGYVRSEKGHGGGWTLACDLSQVTLRGIHEALGRPSLLAVGHRNDAPRCLVEQAVNASLEGAFEEAQDVLLSRLDEVSLETLDAQVRKRLRARRMRHDVERDHA